MTSIHSDVKSAFGLEVDCVIANPDPNPPPRLTGVKVYVAGASAADSNTFRAIQTFWTRYFAESGADFSPYRYGHSLINFENGSQLNPAPK